MVADDFAGRGIRPSRSPPARLGFGQMPAPLRMPLLRMAKRFRRNGLAVDGCFHTFGGEHPSAGPSGVFPDHVVYNPSTDKWTRLPDMPIPVHGVTGLALVNGWIHLPGGGLRMGGSSGAKQHQVVRPEMRCF